MPTFLSAISSGDSRRVARIAFGTGPLSTPLLRLGTRGLTFIKSPSPWDKSVTLAKQVPIFAPSYPGIGRLRNSSAGMVKARETDVDGELVRMVMTTSIVLSERHVPAARTFQRRSARLPSAIDRN